MNKEDWIKRCSKRFQEVANILMDDAIILAKIQFDEDDDNDFIDDPEGAADSEMSYWADDEE